MSRNIAEFEIIGNVGSITRRENVTYVTICANYNWRDGNEWKTDEFWNEVMLFDNAADRLTAEKGDLVRAVGRLRQARYEKNGVTQYTVNLIASSVSVLARKSENNSEH